MLLETLSRRHFKDSTVVGASTARKILEKEGKDSTLETFFWEFTTSEFLDATLFREFSAEWEEQWDVSYALITEVKRIEPYQLSRMKPSAPQEESKTKIEQRVSGVKATLRLSVIRISDSALAWLGETSTKKENTRSVEKVEKEKKGLGEQIIDSIIEGFVSGTFSDTDEPAYPPYPTIDAVIAKTFNCILNKLSKSSSPRWKRYFSDTLTCM